jgi:hypothetical protein
VDRLFAPRNSKNPERLFAPRSGRTGFLNGDARRVLDEHLQSQFVSLSLVRTGGPRHRFSTPELDGDRA